MALIDNLVAYWKCDENAANTNVIDSHGSNDGVASGNTSTLSTDGKIGTAFNFNGTNEDVDFGNITDLDSLSGLFVSCWIRSSGFTPTDVIYRNDGGTLSFTLLTRTSGAMSGQIATGAGTFDTGNSAPGFDDGAWHHVVLRYTGSDLIIYVDGNNENNDATANGTLNNSSKFLFANQGAGNFYPGDIDEVGIWSVDKGAQAVADLYNSGSGLAYPLSIGWANKIFNVVPGKVEGIAVANISKIQGVA